MVQVIPPQQLQCELTSPRQSDNELGTRQLLARISYAESGGRPRIIDGAVRSEVHLATAELPCVDEVWTSTKQVHTGQHRGFAYAHDGEFAFVAGHLPQGRCGGDAVKDAYLRVFELLDDLGYRDLVRIWNFIGRINQLGGEGLETYREFCRGRAEAFEQHRTAMPAATGVGALSPGLNFHVLATRDSVVSHLENPRQVSAYRYPQQYGPKSPSFARATVVDSAAGAKVWVSGTASILGHRTMFPGNIERQCRLSLDNIATLISSANVRTRGLEREYDLRDLRNIKIYVRHREHIEPVRQFCRDAFHPDADLAYFNIDICRSDLLVEIEGIAVR